MKNLHKSLNRNTMGLFLHLKMYCFKLFVVISYYNMPALRPICCMCRRVYVDSFFSPEN